MVLPRCVRAASAAVLLLCFAGHRTAEAQNRGGQSDKPQVPSWLSDKGKDLYNDIEGDEKPYGAQACELRNSLLEVLKGHAEQQATELRVRTLLGIADCDYLKSDFATSSKRFDSAVSELNLPNEDLLTTHKELQGIGMAREAAKAMAKNAVTEAAVALRRSRELTDRNLKKILKDVHKMIKQQSGDQAPPLELLQEESTGLGKTGQYLTMASQQSWGVKQEIQKGLLLEEKLEKVDKKIAEMDPAMAQKRKKLDVTSTKRDGSLLYVRGLAMDAVADGTRLSAAQDLVKKNGALAALLSEVETATKGLTLLKRTKKGTGCKDAPKTCDALLQVPDLASNAFGETRLVITKSKKKVTLDACTTNANVGILMALGAGVTYKVAGKHTGELTAKTPVVVDACLEVILESDSVVPVLFAQAWHPEYAPMERSTEIRARSKTFGLTSEDVTAATKIVNDNAKAAWDGRATQWRKGSQLIELLKDSISAEQKKGREKKENVEKDSEEQQKTDEIDEEAKKEAIRKLEEKRAEQRIAREKAEKARADRKAKLEQERLNKDPWLRSPEVQEAEKNLEDLKDQRRDANAKLEFDTSTQLTKDISAAERTLKKVIKKARKAYKKGGGSTVAADAADGKSTEGGDTSSSSAIDELKAELTRVGVAKKEAAKSEDFKEASRLKKVQQELEEKIENLQKKSTEGGDSSANSAIDELKAELTRVGAAKKEAAKAEDFKEASRLKKQQDELEEKLAKLQKKTEL